MSLLSLYSNILILFFYLMWCVCSLYSIYEEWEIFYHVRGLNIAFSYFVFVLYQQASKNAIMLRVNICHISGPEEME